MVSVKTKPVLIADISHLLGAVGDKFDLEMSGAKSGHGDRDAERDFMAQRCPERLETTVRSLPAPTMHLLTDLAQGPVSVVGLASRSGQLKGTVSKHVQRLVEAGLVGRTPIPGNRKEVELTLTADGHLVCEAHRQLHVEMARGLHDFLAAYENAELEVVETVLRDLLAAQRDGVRITRH